MHLVRLPTGTTSDTPLRLKLTRGHWRLDWVALVRLERRVEPLRISPAAVTRDSVADDDARLALTGRGDPLVTIRGDRVGMRFDLPEPASHYELFLESRGYYLEWMRQEWIAEEDQALALRMFTDPRGSLRRLAPEFSRRKPNRCSGGAAMRGRDPARARASTRSVTIVALCALSLGGCAAATMPEPPPGLPPAELSRDDPFGSWASVQLVGDPAKGLANYAHGVDPLGPHGVQGELVAAERDSLFVFAGDSLRAIASARVMRVQVIRHQAAQPVVESFDAGESAKDRAKHLRRLSAYARFPQGLPPEIDRAALRARH